MNETINYFLPIKKYFEQSDGYVQYMDNGKQDWPYDNTRCNQGIWHQYNLKMKHGVITENHQNYVTYGQIFVKYCPPKYNPHSTRLTTSGNLIKYQGKVSTRTPNLTTENFLVNSTISETDAQFICCENKNFYLGTPMER